MRMIVSRLLFGLCAIVGAAGLSIPNDKKFSFFNERGEDDLSSTQANFYNTFWTDGKSKVTYTNGKEGSYSVTWKEGGNFVGGKGWNPGAQSR